MSASCQQAVVDVSAARCNLSDWQSCLQAWLQTFAWTVSQVSKRQRGLLKRSPTMGPRLHDKPVFCFELGLRLLLWSDVVYGSDDSKDGPGLEEPVRAELEAQQARDASPTSIESGESIKSDGKATEKQLPADSLSSVRAAENGGEGGEDPAEALSSPEAEASESASEQEVCRQPAFNFNGLFKKGYEIAIPVTRAGDGFPITKSIRPKRSTAW